MAVINVIVNTFFPLNTNPFCNRDILLAITDNKHPLYSGKTGQLLASLIWDHYLKYIMNCRTYGRTPIATVCIHEIKSQINRILKILPQSEISKYIHESTTLSKIFTLH